MGVSLWELVCRSQCVGVNVWEYCVGVSVWELVCGS